jgi:hypothetical protein
MRRIPATVADSAAPAFVRRTAELNLSTRRIVRTPGPLRHRGRDAAACEAFTVETGTRGITRARCDAAQPVGVIRATWPDTGYAP